MGAHNKLIGEEIRFLRVWGTKFVNELFPIYTWTNELTLFFL